MDLIDRQEAIDDLHGRDPSQIWDTADIEVWINALPSAQPEYTIEMQESDIDKAMKLVRDARVTILPSAQPEQRWIPVTERLPENGTIALACGKNGGIRVARVFIPYATGNWNGDPNTNWWTVVGTGKSFYPIAWMPLPEPYKEEQE